MAAVRCGTCDDHGDQRVVPLGRRARPRRHRATTRPSATGAYASSSVVAVGVSTHTAPSNRSGSAPSTPSCSRAGHRMPADEPRRRRPRRRSSAFTLPTSVTTPAVSAPARAPRPRSAMAPTGVATNVIVGVGVEADLVDGAELERALGVRRHRRSVPETCQPGRRSAKPIDPPIRPVPTTLARPALMASRR